MITVGKKRRNLELHTSWSTVRAAAIALVLTMALGSSIALAARDRTPPTTPTNLRVTGVTSYTVSFAWNPSTDNSGQFSYVICCDHNSSRTIPQTATTFTWSGGLEAGRTFSFRIFARDAAGNSSKYSNIVTVRLPNDTTPPTRPLISVTDVGPTHVSLAWTATGELGEYVRYGISMDPPVNGSVVFSTTSTSATIAALNPQTTYTFRVRAVDFMNNVPPLSDPVTATTEQAPNDTTPPTTPANLGGSSFGEETWLSWGQSTGNLTPQSLLKYEVYLNRVLDHTLVGRGDTVLYGTAGIINTFEVVAVDESGNKSVPASFQVDLR